MATKDHKLTNSKARSKRLKEQCLELANILYDIYQENELSAILNNEQNHANHSKE